MDKFSEKSLPSLGDYYVYGLIDPRTHQFFYIGKGTGNRVFEHERESRDNPESEKLKLKTIDDIKKQGMDVEKVVINWNLTESEAFAAEAALINALNYVGDTSLTNIVAGHHSPEALSVDDFEKLHGAVELKESDIKHRIMLIKINKLYQRGMSSDELYNAVRGIWRASINKAESVNYVFGVYNSLIVAVYRPTHWYICKDNPDMLPRAEALTAKTQNRIFFIDEQYEQHEPLDESGQFYLHKSIAGLKCNQSAQNPISYMMPST